MMLFFIYLLIYCIILISYSAPLDIFYNDKRRLVILILGYPLLAYNCYILSLRINKKQYKPIIYNIFPIILISLSINYFQQPEILFDPDDIRKRILWIFSILCICLNMSEHIPYFKNYMQ